MKYSKFDFEKDFPNDDMCLDYILAKKYPGKKLYRIDGRKGYADILGKQVYPLKDTIFEKSVTPLTKWFYAIHLFATHKNGVSAMMLQREIRVTYKCAWRMAHKIRSLMGPDKGKLSGIVEADETYIGGRHEKKFGFSKKTGVLGIVERGGRVRVKVIKARTEYEVIPFLQKNIRKGSKLMTDEAAVYKIIRNYKRGKVNHSKKEYARGEIHTNTIEGFWSQLKRSLNGTYHYVSPQHLQKYVNEFAFRYSNRFSPVFEALMERI